MRSRYKAKSAPPPSPTPAPVVAPRAVPGAATSYPAARRHAWIACAVVAITALVHAPAVWYGFVNLDDSLYVSENQHVLDGLTADGVAWAFTTLTESNWHPLTWLSLQLD